MSVQVKVGEECLEEFVVEEKHTASHIGSGTVSVLSTPSMIAFMERTSLDCVQKHLPPQYTTVGTMVNVRHLKPAPLGGKVVVKARVVEFDGKRILFEVEALYNNETIGKGLHERYVVDKEKFLGKVKAR
ncbi:thioesterase family protein [Thermogladius sp.]|uniref:thioesterase family protein n=1 Tax=Thermogladius sp. TaxID=2023064 RepID=UPI003D13CAED